MRALDVTEGFVTISGARVRYIEAGAGPPLLLLHGLGQSSTAWLRSIDRLAQRVRTIALDFPGFGGSDAPVDATYDPSFFARTLDAFASERFPHPVDAIGHSAGGLTLLLDALAHPDRYGKLVLVDPAGFTPAPDNVLGSAATSLFRLLVAMPRNRALTRALYSTAFFDARALDEETVDELVRRGENAGAKNASKRAFTGFFDFCRRLEPFHRALADLRPPALVIWGSDDRLFRSSDATVAERVLRHVRIERFDRCGHCPHIENPERFADVVLEFLTRP
jgi:4,5:9,10-diseco-3-hydroxy-5,9,17-trioxoandrosta-1(10),2-diene-4-oate hydrolase